jgi:ribosomal protein S18 acetylase RimI-like enzyme
VTEPASVKDRLLVRPARQEDLDILVGFSAAMALETEGRQLEVERLRQGTKAVFDAPVRGFYIVAELQGQPNPTVIGQLMVTFEWSDWRNASFWWIQSVYVDPARRRQGVYRAMHRYVLSQAHARPDVCGVRLYVEGENRGAQDVYQRVGLSPSTYQVFENDFVLIKRTKTEK